MSERPGVDANSSNERVETSDDLPGRILSVIYSQKDHCITLPQLFSLVKASQPTIESILDSFCSLGIVRESERKTFCLSENVHIPNLSYTNSSVSPDGPYGSLLKLFPNGIEHVYALPSFQNQVVVIASVPHDVTIRKSEANGEDRVEITSKSGEINAFVLQRRKTCICPYAAAGVAPFENTQQSQMNLLPQDPTDYQQLSYSGSLAELFLKGN